MNILTKISIVVFVVLMLLASIVFINLASVGPNYREAYMGQKIATNSADMMANQKELTLQSANNEIKRLTEELTHLANELADLRLAMDTKLAASDAKILDLTRANASADRRNELQLAESVANNKRADLFLKQLTDTRDELNRRDTEFRDLSQKFQETSAALQRQEKMVASLNEDKTDLMNQLSAMRATGHAAAPSAGVSAGAEYTGTITAVKNDIASINIGSSNGVKVGDKLIVYRDGKFVAYLQIESVDNNVAAGVISDKQADPTQGDKVSSKINNGNM